MNSNNHPIYGTIEYNVWKPLYFHKTNKKTKENEFGCHPNYEIMFMDNKETPFIIQNKKREKTIKSRYGMYTLAKDGVNISYSEIHIAVSSAFPNIKPKYTVDHINDDPFDNRITNLMWMDQSENSKKGQKKSIKNSNTNGGRHGKYVIMKKPDKDDKKNRNRSIAIGLFRSIEKCSKFIIENIIQKDNKPKQGTVSAKIRRAINKPKLTAYGYYYDSFEINIEHEEWKNHPEYPLYQISTHGRIRNSHGIISQQNTMRCGSSYKNVSISNMRKYVHVLVWEAWVGNIPDGMDILHDDSAPKNEDGSYRNWLCDLSIGTRSENMVSFHKNKNTVNNIQKEDKFIEKIPEIGLLSPLRTFPTNPLGDLMRNAPQGIQFIKAKNRGNKYVLSRLYSKTAKDISTTSKKNVSDEEKFLEVLKIYQVNCLDNKQDKALMEIDIDEYKKYIPQ